MDIVKRTKQLTFLLIGLDIALVAFGVVIGDDFVDAFKERRLVSLFSVFQLVVISLISLVIFLEEKKNTGNFSIKAPYLIWGIIAICFLYMGIDELVEIHESLDKLIHSVFNIEETKLTDRIDDLIIFAYLIGGLGAIYYYKDYLLRYKSALKYFIAGVIIVSIMIVIDILTNRKDFLRLFFEDRETRRFMYDVFIVVEEAVTIIAESVLIATVYYCKKINSTLIGENKSNG